MFSVYRNDKLIFTGERKKAVAFLAKRKRTDGGKVGVRAVFRLEPAEVGAEKFRHKHKFRSH